MKNTLLLFLTFCFTNISTAQLFEIGGFLGGSNYVGEVGPTTFIRPNKIAYGGVFKYNYSTRIAFRGSFSNLPIFAKDSESKNTERKSRNFTAKNNISEIGLGIEFNFFDYNVANWKIDHTPYFIFESVVFRYNKSDENSKKKTGVAIPLGIGYKAKLFDKFAFALETRVRYTLTDFTENGEMAGNIYNNTETNDWYFFSGFSLVYTFGRPPCYHRNNR